MTDLYEPLADTNNLAGPPPDAQRSQPTNGPALGEFGNTPPRARSPLARGRTQQRSQKDRSVRNRSVKERKKNPLQERRNDQFPLSPCPSMLKVKKGAEDAKQNKPRAGTPKNERKSDMKRHFKRDAAPRDSVVKNGKLNKEKAPSTFAGAQPPFGDSPVAPGGTVNNTPPPIQDFPLGATPGGLKPPPGASLVHKSEMPSLMESSSGGEKDKDYELNANKGQGDVKVRKYEDYDIEKEIEALESNLELYDKQERRRARRKHMKLYGIISASGIIIFGAIFTILGLVGVLLNFKL